MDDHCPECSNEIYKPYTYCNACSWQKKEGEPKKERKDKKEKKKAPTKAESGKTIKIKCKCGGDIKIKSTSKPVKIKCPDCGRTGVFKGIGKSEGAKPKSKPKKEKVSKSVDVKERREPGARDGKRARREDHDHRERKHNKKEKTGHKESVRTKVRPRSRSEDDLDRRPRGRKRPTHRPPAHSKVVKHIKGRCSRCQSRNLRFFDDGSGRCADCGKEFKSSRGASRIQKKEYLCEHCREPLEFVKEYDRWYCYKCNEYA